jgi:UDP-N-acetylglucosamine 2-epimerase (non-hydrolysing)
VTAQHREMLDGVLKTFEVQPHYDLDVMRDGQSLTESAARILERLEPVLKQDRPDMVLVQGDTTTTLCGALAAFYQNIAVGHVEAGLRTGDMWQPFPEEMNRLLVSRLATLHFAATSVAAGNLLAEGVPEDRVFVTGNSGIDAVMYVRDRIAVGSLKPRTCNHDSARRMILVTAHRRESFGAGFERICEALRRISALDSVRVVYPVHPNPNVSGVVRESLRGYENIDLLEPLDYVTFVDLMQRSHLILTDSGGIQEEAPSLGKPVLVLRDNTERPEAVHAGTATLVGTGVDSIVSVARHLLEDEAEYDRRRRIHNPYGDGRASARIADAILAWSRLATSRGL